MWGFIAFVIIISIMFGVTLHEAFWGIIAFSGVLCALGWGFGTESGKKFVKWSCIVVGVLAGIFLAYQGIVKKTGDQKQYNTDISSCENDTWRYVSAKVYYTQGRDFYYDQNKVQSIYDSCIKEASKNSQARNNWWWVEAGSGILIVLLALVATKDGKQNSNHQVNHQ